MKKIIRILKKIKRVFTVNYIAKTRYRKYYDTLSLDNKAILLDPQHGTNINGNIFYILKELTTNLEYQDYKVYLSVTKKNYKKIKNFLDSQNITNYELVKMESFKYYKLIASVKYLFSDTSFLAFYIKKEGQVYTNVWHGTPLKCLGKSDNNNYHAIGNVQKNFILADYLLYPSEYMMKHMIADYMLENICKAKVLLCGYPRNTIFFDEDNRKKIKNEYNLNDKEVFIYMPTWRGTEDEMEVTSNYLKEIDKKLKSNQILYVNLHPFIGNKLDYTTYKNIKPFPKKYETYQFLNIADALITDYSSVFIDFANIRKPIILFTFDEDTYYEDRGCYLKVTDLPFPRAKTVDELIDKLNDKKEVDYQPFLDEFCKYDSKDTTKKLLDRVIKNKKVLEERDIFDNHKPNILIYTGSLAKNGITSSLMNLLPKLDTKKYNYYLNFLQSAVRSNKEVLKQIPKEINYIATTNGLTSSLKEKILIYLYFKGLLKSEKVQNKINNIYKYELKRCFGDIKFSHVIQFGGYERKKIVLYSLFDSQKIIYVHSDMRREIKYRGNQNANVLNYAYNNYDKVAVVSKAMKKPTATFMKNTDNLYVVDNLIADEEIKNKGKLDITFDEDTECNIDFDKLKQILNNKNYKKFINVGRFSVEKGHIRLINAFNKIWKNNQNCYLVLIGGHGKMYKKTLKHIKSLACKDNVIVIKSVKNPFPIVKKCDCFVLSSLYEGFGLCLVEADILGLTTFAVDIDGPKDFIKKYHGHLVDNSEEGIYQGMLDYLNGKIDKMQVDYDEYNKKALEEYNSLLEVK